MIRIRPYKTADVNTILSWCQNEKAFLRSEDMAMGKRCFDWD